MLLPVIFTLVSLYIDNTRFVGETGTFIHKLYSENLNEISDGELCRQWAGQQNITFIEEMSHALVRDGPGCPCSKIQAADDKRFLVYRADYQTEDAECFFTLEEGFYMEDYGSLVCTIVKLTFLFLNTQRESLFVIC